MEKVRLSMRRRRMALVLRLVRLTLRSMALTLRELIVECDCRCTISEDFRGMYVIEILCCDSLRLFFHQVADF
jgi:hypothetical protein